MIVGGVFKNLRQGLVAMALVAGLASGVGLMFSLVFPRVSTVPAQVLTLLVLLTMMRLVFSRFGRTA